MNDPIVVTVSGGVAESTDPRVLIIDFDNLEDDAALGVLDLDEPTRNYLLIHEAEWLAKKEKQSQLTAIALAS